MRDVRHVVIPTQENRSFDRFDDRQVWYFPTATPCFVGRARRGRRGSWSRSGWTPPGSNTNIDELLHDWESGHDAINRGARP